MIGLDQGLTLKSPLSFWATSASIALMVKVVGSSGLLPDDYTRGHEDEMLD